MYSVTSLLKYHLSLKINDYKHTDNNTTTTTNNNNNNNNNNNDNI